MQVRAGRARHSVRRSRQGRRSGRDGSGGSASAMSRSSLSVRPTTRPAQQCPEGKRIPAVSKGTGQSNEVVNLLPTKEALAGLRRHRNAPVFERLFEPPEVCSCRRQQSNVSESARSLLLGCIIIADRYVTDQPVAEVSDAIGFGVSQGRCDWLLPTERDIQRRDGRHSIEGFVCRRKRGKAGLARRLRQHALEALIHKIEDWSHRPEIGRYLQKRASCRSLCAPRYRRSRRHHGSDRSPAWDRQPETARRDAKSGVSGFCSYPSKRHCIAATGYRSAADRCPEIRRRARVDIV